MPIVNFKCLNSLCSAYDAEYEEMFSIKEKSYESHCKECGQKCKRIWMGVAPVIEFTGSGFHCQEYGKYGRKENG